MFNSKFWLIYGQKKNPNDRKKFWYLPDDLFKMLYFTQQVKTRSSLPPKRIMQHPALRSSWRKTPMTHLRREVRNSKESFGEVAQLQVIYSVFSSLVPGLILPNGEINWNCPCLGGMASGPCGTEFKDAFSCFHYSKKEVKGSDCLEQFRSMQECMQRYPELYPQEDDKSPSDTPKDSESTDALDESSTSASDQDSDTKQANTES